MQKIIRRNLIFATVVVIALAAIVIRCDRRTGGRRIADAESRKPFESKCGTAPQVANRIGKCLDPLLDLIEGRESAPKGDADSIIVCDKFNVSEKCIRNSGRDCLSGIHKTAVGSFASATKRFHTKECKTQANRAKYLDTLRCLSKTRGTMEPIYKNMTAIAQAVRDSPELTPEEKIMRVCCLLNTLDKEIEVSINRFCPQHLSQVIGIVHAISDDVRTSLCVSPKCSGALDKAISQARYKPPQNFIEPLMEILFMLG